MLSKSWLIDVGIYFLLQESGCRAVQEDCRENETSEVWL